MKQILHRFFAAPRSYKLLQWFDAFSVQDNSSKSSDNVDWLRLVPFIMLHLSVICVFFCGWSPFVIGVAVFLYFIRMFAITAFYHRYFSHRTFKTSRLLQFIFAVIGNLSIQRGPIWWASHHRHHHRYSDKPEDEHSPVTQSFLKSHMFWFMSVKNFQIRKELVKDLIKYPELVWIDRFNTILPIIFGIALFGFGDYISRMFPSLQTTGFQVFVWGFVISTLAVHHVTFSVNSLAHKIGHKNFDTGDESRNNFILAILTLGEGWHNNHHFYPFSARQGFVRGEIDISYFILRVMEKFGLVWSIRDVPEQVLQKRFQKEV